LKEAGANLHLLLECLHTCIEEALPGQIPWGWGPGHNLSPRDDDMKLWIGIQELNKLGDNYRGPYMLGPMNYYDSKQLEVQTA
jgi:hypothetical protein